MAPSEATRVRVALIDDDSGLLTVLDRRFAGLRWEREVLQYAAGPEQLAAMRIHALIVNPALTGLDYIEQIAAALPGLSLLVHSPPAPVADRVRGLRGGADDWISKPCHPEELVARIQAVLRRRRAGRATGAGRDHRRWRAGHPARPLRRLRPGDEPAGLSRKEYELLHQLAAAEGRVLEREDIYQRVWGYTMARGDRSVDVFVRKLRQKLERLSPGLALRAHPLRRGLPVRGRTCRRHSGRGHARPTPRRSATRGQRRVLAAHASPGHRSITRRLRVTVILPGP